MKCPNCNAELRQDHALTNKRYCFFCGWQGYLVTTTYLHQTVGGKIPTIQPQKPWPRTPKPVPENAPGKCDGLCAPSTSEICEEAAELRTSSIVKQTFQIIQEVKHDGGAEYGGELPRRVVELLRSNGLHVARYHQKGLTTTVVHPQQSTTEPKTVRRHQRQTRPCVPILQMDSYEIFDILPDPLVEKLRASGIRVSVYSEKRIGPSSTVLRWNRDR